jgi:hypothetical protein
VLALAEVVRPGDQHRDVLPDQQVDLPGACVSSSSSRTSSRASGRRQQRVFDQPRRPALSKFQVLDLS